MKRLLAYLFLALGLTILFQSKSFAIPKNHSGEGELFLKEKIIEEYLSYLNTRTSDHSLNFFISEDKKHVFSVVKKNWGHGNKGYSYSGPIERNWKKCERKLKQKCYLFSNTRFIVWDNGINPVRKDESFLKRTITREGLILKLKKLGFIGESKSETKRIVSQKKSKLKTGEQIAQEAARNKKEEKKKLKAELAKLIKDKTQIAKKEPKKEKKKVAKVVEQKQDEIKPTTTSKDTKPPTIEIAEAITVDDSQYSIEGKVSDEGSDKIYIKVDGRDVVVKKGKFKINRYSPVDEVVSIVAIDKWGNKSTKKVLVKIKIKDTGIAEKLEPLNPSNIKVKSFSNKVALIIGIENYTEAPKANYANLDAKYFFDYARKAFGVKKQNINLLINEDATFVKTSKALTLWLRTKVKADQTDLIVFFAGHGLASSDGKELYILPQDGDPDLLSRTAISRTELFAEIISLKPKSVTMFLDTCYSGVSRDEQMLLASARPIRIVADDEGEIPDNFTIFSATELDQISSGMKEAKHGIFSYYLMKGLEGKADSDKDKQITNGELLAYMDINVSQKASELGRQQNPSLAGDPDQILMSY